MNDTPPKTLFLFPQIEDAFPHQLKEALARRRLVALTGRCLCGARPDIPTTTDDDILVATVIHNEGCPAPLAEQLLNQYETRKKRGVHE